MSLPIVHYNDPILRKKGEKITVFDAALVKLANQLVDSMHAAEGIGLAAQITRSLLDIQEAAQAAQPASPEGV